MSWLIPLILTGAMFASADGNNLQPVRFTNENTNAKTTIQIEETERFEQTYPLNATGRVSVSNVNGSITVDVWDNAQVRLEYVKTAESRERLADVEVKIDARQDYFKVETDFENLKRGGERKWRNGGKLAVEYRLTVPRTAVLNEIAAVNGSINISNAANQTKASAVNGQITATNLRGAATLSTVNGSVRADFDSLQTGGSITLETVNGTAELTVPSDASATVKADTLNGQITNDFGLPVRKGQFVGRNLYGRIGNGDAQIRLNSVNGALSIKRKNDARNPSPATNLLSEKSGENGADSDVDADIDDKSGSPARPPRPPRAPRAPRPPAAPRVEIDDEAIRKSVEEALKEAGKEIGGIEKSLKNIDAQALKEVAAAINSPEMRAQLKNAREMALSMNANYAAAPRVEDKSESFAVRDKPRVAVKADDCDVTVRGWDRPEVRYAATRVATGAPPFDLRATQNGTDIDIKVLSGYDGSEAANKNNAYNNLFDGSIRTRIEIFVPRKSDLKIKTGGAIRLEGVSGEIDLQGSDESINVRDADGKLNVGTSDGAIRVIGFRGALVGKTGDGAMNLEGDFQSLSASTADGTIVLTLPDDADALLESNREIDGEAGVNLMRESASGKIWRVGRGGSTIYRFNAGDGKIVVRSAKSLKAIL